MDRHDEYKLATPPNYDNDEVETYKADFSVEGNEELVKEFEKKVAELANIFGLDLDY